MATARRSTGGPSPVPMSSLRSQRGGCVALAPRIVENQLGADSTIAAEGLADEDSLSGLDLLVVFDDGSE